MKTIVCTALLLFACSALGIRGGETLSDSNVSVDHQIQVSSSLVEIRSKDDNGGQYACTGSVIAPQLVLTSAHCFDIGLNRWQVQLNGHAVDVSEVGIHKRYKREEVFDAYWKFLLEIRLHHDLALLKTAHPLSQQRLQLPLNAIQQSDLTLFMVGYGQTEHLFGIGSGEGVLRIAGPMRIEMSMADRIHITDRKEGGCLGDSGGPLLAELNGRLTIVGVLSQSDCMGKTTYQQVTESMLAHRDFLWGPVSKREPSIIYE